MTKSAFVVGVSGQDGSYLAEYLLDKGYRVVGLKRRSSTPNEANLVGIKNSHLANRFELEEGDVTDPFAIQKIISDNQFDEIYNLAAQSHVKTSFEIPTYTSQTNFMGVLNILEAIRVSSPNSKFYQASTSEMFGSNYSYNDTCLRVEKNLNDFPPPLTTSVGNTSRWSTESQNLAREFYQQHRTQYLAHYDFECFQDELTPFAPNSPYSVAKLAAHNMVRVYRESYGLKACCGILFNHESPRRGDMFVTQKIAKWVAQYKMGVVKTMLELGNVNAKRDWGHSRDFVRGMYKMLQQENEVFQDYVLATGTAHSVLEFFDEAMRAADIPYDDWKKLIHINKDFLRPCEVPLLRGNASKAKTELGWVPETTFAGLVDDMVKAQLAKL